MNETYSLGDAGAGEVKEQRRDRIRRPRESENKQKVWGGKNKKQLRRRHEPAEKPDIPRNTQLVTHFAPLTHLHASVHIVLVHNAHRAASFHCLAISNHDRAFLACVRSGRHGWGVGHSRHSRDAEPRPLLTRLGVIAPVCVLRVRVDRGTGAAQTLSDTKRGQRGRHRVDASVLLFERIGVRLFGNGDRLGESWIARRGGERRVVDWRDRMERILAELAGHAFKLPSDLRVLLSLERRDALDHLALSHWVMHGVGEAVLRVVCLRRVSARRVPSGGDLLTVALVIHSTIRRLARKELSAARTTCELGL